MNRDGGATSTAPSPPPRTATIVTTAPAPASSSATPAATSAPRSTVAPAPATSSSAGTTGCSNTQLKVTSKSLSGATSHNGLLIVFTNTSNKTCSLYGYPGAAALDSKGVQIVQATRTLRGFLSSCGCKAPGHITLHPGGTASAAVEGNNGGGDECLRNKSLLVTPPNTTRSTKFSFQDYSCDLQIHPVTAGTKVHPPS